MTNRNRNPTLNISLSLGVLSRSYLIVTFFGIETQLWVWFWTDWIRAYCLASAEVCALPSAILVSFMLSYLRFMPGTFPLHIPIRCVRRRMPGTDTTKK